MCSQPKRHPRTEYRPPRTDMGPSEGNARMGGDVYLTLDQCRSFCSYALRRMLWK